MERSLAENIRDARKRMGLTQEQLAERLGVTLGTISKWERGASEPEIGYLMGLAEVFRVSVDALIGFSLRGGDPDSEAERIEELMDDQNGLWACEEYEKALRRFPNHFRLVLGAAKCNTWFGTVYKNDDKMREAIELYRHAIELLSQNTDESVSEVSLRNEIAQCYSHLKEHRRAIEEYKQNNVCGINNAKIGLALIQDEKKDKEGIVYMVTAFINNLAEIMTIMAGYMQYYLHTGEYANGIRSVTWTLDYLYSMKERSDKRAYVDKMISIHLLILALAYDLTGRKQESEQKLDEAVRLAKEFDAEPMYVLENTVFAEFVRSSYVYDSTGPTAVSGLISVLDTIGEVVPADFRKRLEAKLAE